MNNQFEKMQKLAFGKTVMSTPETLTEGTLKDKIKEIVHSTLGEAKKKKKDVAPQEDVDINVDTEEAPMPDETSTEDALAPTDMGDSSEVDIDPKVKSIQDYLQKAYANAKSLGDEKLMTQIGNTITMVVRNQVLGGQAVAESLNEMEDTYSQDEVTNDILNDGIGNKDRGTVFFEAWHLATNSGMTDEEAWNVYTKGDVNIKESLEEIENDDVTYYVIQGKKNGKSVYFIINDRDNFDQVSRFRTGDDMRGKIVDSGTDESALADTYNLLPR
jgi:hypothetical protein